MRLAEFHPPNTITFNSISRSERFNSSRAHENTPGVVALSPRSHPGERFGRYLVRRHGRSFRIRISRVPGPIDRVQAFSSSWVIR